MKTHTHIVHMGQEDGTFELYQFSIPSHNSISQKSIEVYLHGIFIK